MHRGKLWNQQGAAQHRQCCVSGHGRGHLWHELHPFRGSLCITPCTLATDKLNWWPGGVCVVQVSPSARWALCMKPKGPCLKGRIHRMQSSGQHQKLTTNITFCNEWGVTTGNLHFTLLRTHTSTSHGRTPLSKHAYRVGAFPKAKQRFFSKLCIVSYKSPIQQLEKQSIIILLSLLIHQYISVAEEGLGVRQLGLYFWFW